MATLTATSSYVGDALKKYILAAILGGETLATQGISVQTNIKYKRKIKKLAVGNIVACGSCDFSATSGVTITEAVLEPCDMKINEEICFEDLYQLWDSADMSAGMHNENIPQSLMDGLVEGYTKEAAQEIEKAIWQNDDTATGTTYCACFDGYEVQLAAGGITGGTGATLTVANVVTMLNAAYALVPAAVLAKPKSELVIFMSHKGLSLYQQNLATQGVNTTCNEQCVSLYGIQIVPISGLSDDDIIVIGERANFYVGTDLESDFNEIKTIDMRQTTGDDSVRFIMKWKLDVAIAYPNEVVYYNA